MAVQLQRPESYAPDPQSNNPFPLIQSIGYSYKERGLTVILVTHDQTEANALADRIAVMEDGVPQQFASPAALRDRLANRFVDAFSGRLGGAMLETFAVEPVPSNWTLLGLPNVTLTPHIAGASLKTVRIAAAQVTEEVRRFIAGEPPFSPC